MYSFIVLPALALYLYIAWRVVGALYRRTSSQRLRFSYPAIAIVFFALAPFADIFYPRWKLAQLCETEAKTEILTSVVLPAEYFGADGTLVRRSDHPNNIDWERLKAVLKIQSGESKVGSGLSRTFYSVVDQKTGATIVKKTSFLYRGGWMGFTNTGFGEAQCRSPTNFETVLANAVKRSDGR